MNLFKKIIIKVGTSTLTQGTQTLCKRFMLGLVQQMAELQGLGVQILLVSSGAVAAGRDLLSSQREGLSKRHFASVGQVKLMQVWTELFSLYEIQTGQILLTQDDFTRPRQSLTRDTIEGLLEHEILPIINENDTTASQEGRIGDNDNLAALVGNLIEADLMILLTDQEGLYTANPRLDPDAKLIPVVEEINEAIFALAGGSPNSLGTGGMKTKIEAAKKAVQSGIQMVIASASSPRVLIDLANGNLVGTVFLKEGKNR